MVIGTTSPISTFHVAGDAYIEDDTTIMGNLSVRGDLIYLDTSVSLTSALSVVNKGTGPALFVAQEGTQPIARFIDREGGEIHFTDTGKVGIGTPNPSEYLEVSGGDIQVVTGAGTNRIYTSELTGDHTANGIGIETEGIGNQMRLFGYGTSTNMLIESKGSNSDIRLNARKDIGFYTNTSGTAYSLRFRADENSK